MAPASVLSDGPKNIFIFGSGVFKASVVYGNNDEHEYTIDSIKRKLIVYIHGDVYAFQGGDDEGNWIWLEFRDRSSGVRDIELNKYCQIGGRVSGRASFDNPARPNKIIGFENNATSAKCSEFILSGYDESKGPFTVKGSFDVEAYVDMPIIG